MFDVIPIAKRDPAMYRDIADNKSTSSIPDRGTFRSNGSSLFEIFDCDIRPFAFSSREDALAAILDLAQQIN